MILKTARHTAIAYALVHSATGAHVAKGDTVISFRGEAHIVTGGEPPLHRGSTGRVYVMKSDCGQLEGEYYPSVFDLVWQVL